MGVSIRPPIAEGMGTGRVGPGHPALPERACPSHTLPPAPRSPLFGPPGHGKTPQVAFFFLTFFLVAPKVAPGLQKGGPGCPKGVPKTPKSSQNGLPQRSPKKRLEKVARQCIFREAGCAIRSRLCSPNTLFRFRAPAGKVIQKASQKLPEIVQNSCRASCHIKRRKC